MSKSTKVRGFISPLASQLTPQNWREMVRLKEMTHDEMTELLADVRLILSFAKQAEGLLKEAVRARVPQGLDLYRLRRTEVQVEHVVRKAGLDEEKITEEMGEEWVEAHRKKPIEYDQVKVIVLDEVEA